MKIVIREGSAAKSLNDLSPVVRKAIQLGIEPIAAISMATLNTDAITE